MKTIKEIAPYLPYGLEVIILNYKSDYVGIKKSFINGFYFIKNNPHFTYVGGSTGKSFDDCKFIMRPLSDLTLPCLEDGKIPLVELGKIAFPNSEWHLDSNVVESDTGMWFLFNEDSNGFSVDGTVSNYVPNQFQLFQKLFEWHFDIFGLIEEGLAIDINTLNNIPNEIY